MKYSAVVMQLSTDLLQGSPDTARRRKDSSDRDSNSPAPSSTGKVQFSYVQLSAKYCTVKYSTLQNLVKYRKVASSLFLKSYMTVRLYRGLDYKSHIY